MARARSLALALALGSLAGRAGAQEAEQALAALDQCLGELQSCRVGKEGSREASANGSRPPPPWPDDYGKLLRFPFGMSDMKALKDMARLLWQPDGTAATLGGEVTDRGFAPLQGARCTSEMVGVHPVGGSGERWSAQLWGEAQDWCLERPECTGIMLFVGTHNLNCHHWCGRPQFCSGQISGEEGVEASADWNLWVRTTAPAAEVGGA